ncbi:ABC transporter substrate-binding protein [Bacillus sp. SD088]|uniref:ABC transporter substrate-binding protein n=1 Tax=Bacillus sp. SD088 TaxID=2782012 RepID=UPI001A96562F|nr:extracellular solute-binding protein [Bacillus sp. SD088]MBO0995488.1 extracellular solute-binding protein [Bacillus sp. SD088]
MKKSLVVYLGFIVMLLVGCQNGAQDTSGDENDANEAEVVDESVFDEPVTLTLWNKAMGIIDQEMADELFAPALEKYRNLSIEMLKDVNIEEMIASGKVPDLIATSNYSLLEQIDMELVGDMSEFFETSGLSLDQFNPAIVENLNSFAELTGKPGAIYGMPVSMNQGVLAYNKDIFDQFGVSYPESGMTWDEVIELSKQVTGNVGGTDYIGFSPGGPQIMSRPRSLPVVDENGKATINTPEYQEIFRQLEQLYQMPGVVNEEQYNYNFNYFMEERRLAMVPYWFAAFTSRIPIMEETGVNWGLTSFPTTSENPDLGREIDYHLFLVPETAENREAAMLAVAELVTEEAQTYLGKEVLRLSVLDNEEIRGAYAEGAGLYEQEVLDDIFSVEPAPTPTPTLYDADIYSILGEAQRKLAIDKVDINTVLREAEEEADKKVQELQEKEN